MSKSSARFAAVAATACAVVLSLHVATACAATRQTNGIVVALEPRATSAQVDAVLKKAGGTLVHAVPSTRSLLVSQRAGASATTIAQELTQLPGVRYAEPNYRISAQAVPNDPMYSLQWGLAAVDAPVAWEGARGSSAVRVAVIDSGVYFGHPDLAGVLDNTRDYDYVNSDTDASDDNGHGTHVTGIIAAIANNSIGVASLGGFGTGASGGVRVIPYKVLDENGDGWDEDVALAIRRAADAGARVINLSMGGPGSASLSEAVTYAHVKGCVIVGAAGNSGWNQVLYPAGYPGVIGVGSVESDLKQALFSNSGAHVDVVAPGEQVFSTSWPYGRGSAGDLYGYMSGTSMAAPMVAAEAALLFSAKPTATNTQVETAIISSARDLGAPGRDDEYGNGIIDAAAALSRLVGYDYTAPVTVASGFSDGWDRDSVTVTLKATDDLSGVASIEYAVGDGSLKDYAGPFAVSAEGVTKIAYSSVDKAGNREQTRIATVRIDRVAPVTSFDAQSAYVGSAKITLTGRDTLSGVGATKWLLDGVQGSGSVVTTSAYGMHALTFWSVDVAGNAEAPRSVGFFVLNSSGEVPPLTTVALGVSGGWSSAPATISLVSAGGNGPLGRSTWYSVDGAKMVQYFGPFAISEEGTSTLDFWSYDGGAAEQLKRVVVRVDSGDPTLTVSARPVYDETAIITAVAADEVSGLDASALAWSIDGGTTWMRGLTAAITDPGHYDVIFKAADLAGNESRVVAKVTVMADALVMLVQPDVASTVWGAPVTLLGGLSPAPAGPAAIAIQARPYGASAWSTVARVRADASGAFAVRVTPTRRTVYRAVFLGDDVLRAAAPSALVTLRPRVALTPVNGVPLSVSAGVTLRLSGRVTPTHPGGVYLVAERKSGSSWVGRRVLHVDLTPDGSGASRWRASIALARGTWRLRAYHPSDILHSATYSAARYATVR